MPSLELAAVYTDRVGAEVLNQMYSLPDKGGRLLCLRPEGTATCQLLARERLRQERDVQLFYVASCWRYERPQAGRYREFVQFGVEVLNPTRDWRERLIDLASEMVSRWTTRFEVSRQAKRGLGSYLGDGFEISCPSLGAQKQVCGGGTYAEGCGFALGIDRLTLAAETPPAR